MISTDRGLEIWPLIVVGLVALMVAIAGCGPTEAARDADAGAVSATTLAPTLPSSLSTGLASGAADPEQAEIGSQGLDEAPSPVMVHPGDSLAGPSLDTSPDVSALLSPLLSSFCPSTAHSVVVDRERQTAWLCDSGTAIHQFPFTGAISQPDAGTYEVYANDLRATSSGVTPSTMTHFVAFTRGKFRGARIAFHSVPIDGAGNFVQPLDSVGDVQRRGESAGCLRVLPDDAVRVWDWLAEGDQVRVIN